jgi:hypothetical protein
MNGDGSRTGMSGVRVPSSGAVVGKTATDVLTGAVVDVGLTDPTVGTGVRLDPSVGRPTDGCPADHQMTPPTIVRRISQPVAPRSGPPRGLFD